MYSEKHFDTREEIPKEFALLWDRIDAEWKRIDSERKRKPREQLIAMKVTLDDSTDVFVKNIDIDSQDSEKKVLSDLMNYAAKFDIILCVWSSGEPDVPSYSFRKELAEVDPENKEAQMLYKNEEGYHIVKLKDTAPSLR